MMIYSPPGDNEDLNLWTKEVLLSVREFEKDVVKEDDYSVTCWARQTSPDDLDDVECVDDALDSPLGLLTDEQVKGLESIS